MIKFFRFQLTCQLGDYCCSDNMPNYVKSNVQTTERKNDVPMNIPTRDFFLLFVHLISLNLTCYRNSNRCSIWHVHRNRISLSMFDLHFYSRFLFCCLYIWFHLIWHVIGTAIASYLTCSSERQEFGHVGLTFLLKIFLLMHCTVQLSINCRVDYLIKRIETVVFTIILSKFNCRMENFFG